MGVVVSVVGQYSGKDIDRAQQQLNRLSSTVKSSSGGVSGAFSKMGSAIGSVAGRIGSAIVASGLITWLKASVEAAKKSQVTNARLKASVDATGASYAKLLTQITKNVAAMSRFSGFGKGELKNALAELTQRTGSLTKAQELMGLAMDVARAKGIPVEDAAKKLGMVLAGNTRVLKEFGIKAYKGGTATAYLAQIQKKAKGQAKEYGDTAAGAEDKFDNALKGLQVTVGTSLLPTISTFMTSLTDLVTKFDALPQPVKDVSVAVGGLATAMLLANSALGPIGAICVGIGLAAMLIYQNWDKIKPVLEGVAKKFQPLVTAFTNFWKVAGPPLERWFGILKDVWIALQPLFTQIAAVVGGALTAAFENLKEAWETLQPALQPLMYYFKLFGEWLSKNLPVIIGICLAPLALLVAAVVAVVVVFAKIVQGITWCVKTVAQFLAAVSILAAGLGVLWVRIQTKAQEIWDRLVTFLTTTWDGIVATASGWGDSVCSGIVDGLTNGIKAIEDAASTLATKLIDAVKNVLGIHSPSTVFAEIAGHVIGGFVGGLNFSNAISIIKKAFGGIWKFAGNVPSLLSSIFDSGDSGTIAAALRNITGLSGGFGSVARGLAEAMSMVGKPYVWGAMSKAAADCSGLVSLVLQSMGLHYGRLTTATIPHALQPGKGRQVSVGLVPGKHTGIGVMGKWFEAKGKKWGILGPGKARSSWPTYFHPKGFERGGFPHGPLSGYSAVLHGHEAIVPLAQRFRSQALAMLPPLLSALGIRPARAGNTITVQPGAVVIQMPAGADRSQAASLGDAAAQAFLGRLVQEIGAM